MLFMNSAMEEYHAQPRHVKSAVLPTSMQRLEEIIPLDRSLIPSIKSSADVGSNPYFVTRSSCHEMFLDYDKFFEPVLRHVTTLALESDLQVKRKHSIVEPWPYSVKPRITKDEFEVQMASGLMGYERYMELERVG